MIDGETRRYAAALGRRHFEGTMTLEALIEHFGASDDPLILALLEAAAHQPSRGHGGISQKKWEQDFWRPVSGLLGELEKGAEGMAPNRRVYPKSGFGPVVGWSAFSLFAGASAAENAMDLFRLHGEGVLWNASIKGFFMILLCGATVVGIRTALYSLYLFRTRDTPYEREHHRAG